MKYSIICMWDNYDYYNNFFTNILNNYECCNINDDIHFLISGPFINDEYCEIIKNKNCIKVLYITEPIEINILYNLCYDLYKNNIFNYTIGCINNNINSYKHSLYLIYINIDNDIFKEVNNYVKNCSLDKDFCTLINSHDSWNVRTPIYNKLINLKNINCPSRLFNNCSNEELNNIGNVEYIKKFLFNICSENTLTSINGYITEKIMNCCLGGAIPIYCGWFDDIDEQIFNRDRILFYEPNNEESLNNLYNKVKELLENNDRLNEFYRMNVFKDTALETCKNMHYNLLSFFNNI